MARDFSDELFLCLLSVTFCNYFLYVLCCILVVVSCVMYYIP